MDINAHKIIRSDNNNEKTDLFLCHHVSSVNLATECVHGSHVGGVIQ